MLDFIEKTPKGKRMSEPRYRREICEECDKLNGAVPSECCCGLFFAQTVKPNRRDGGIYSVMRKIYLEKHAELDISMMEIIPVAMEPMPRSDYKNHKIYVQWQVRTSGVKNYDPNRAKKMPKLPTDSSYIHQVKSGVILELYRKWHFIEPFAADNPTQGELIKIVNHAIHMAHWYMEDCEDRGDHASKTWTGSFMAYKMLREAKKKVFVRDEWDTIKFSNKFTLEQEKEFMAKLNMYFKLSD